MTRDELDRALPPPKNARGAASRRRMLNGVEDFLFIGGERLPVRQAADRLGVTKRTVERYRSTLKQAGGA